jgi:acyl-CoA oxidase
MAQLIVGGKPHGPHPFVVPVRDMKTHEPLEGRYLGDIGPKIGFNTMDNGFLLLNNVEIPHVNMLAKHSRVDPQTNQYVKPSSPTLVYGTMTWVRSTIVLMAGSTLARGVTVAIRYTAIRRQFQDRDTPPHLIGKGENQVLDYTMVQYRLLPLLASTFALHFTGKGMMKMYKQRQAMLANSTEGNELAQSGSSKGGAGPEEISTGSDFMADLHATSCGLKALGSTIAGEGLETCRRACGGHGYSR